MASFVLSGTNSTTAQTLADGEFGFINDDSALEVDGVAVTASGEVALAVFGRLFGSEIALEQDDGFLVLEVGRDARVGGGEFDTIDFDGDSTFISNHGRIGSNEDALEIEATISITIVNDGLLRGDSDGIVTDCESGLTRIVNRGNIVGRDDGGIDHLAGDVSLINRGTISGPDYGYDGEDGNEEIRNFGSIEGGVFLYASGDFVENRGEIDFIDLGGGDDIYFGRGTGSAGRVDGGGGGDLLVSSRADDTFIGGGAGDVFIFLPRGGADRILDFGGTDRIDLSVFELESFRADIRDRLEERPNGTLIDFSDRDLTIFLRDVDKDDVRASDFILEPPIM